MLCRGKWVWSARLEPRGGGGGQGFGVRGGAGDPLPWAVAWSRGQPRGSIHSVGLGHWVGPSPVLEATPLEPPATPPPLSKALVVARLCPKVPWKWAVLEPKMGRRRVQNGSGNGPCPPPPPFCGTNTFAEGQRCWVSQGLGCPLPDTIRRAQAHGHPQGRVHATAMRRAFVPRGESMRVRGRKRERRGRGRGRGGRDRHTPVAHKGLGLALHGLEVRGVDGARALDVVLVHEAVAEGAAGVGVGLDLRVGGVLDDGGVVLVRRGLVPQVPVHVRPQPQRQVVVRADLQRRLQILQRLRRRGGGGGGVVGGARGGGGVLPSGHCVASLCCGGMGAEGGGGAADPRLGRGVPEYRSSPALVEPASAQVRTLFYDVE